MKKIILYSLFASFIVLSCQKNSVPEINNSFKTIKNENSDLVKDWIGLQLKLIKNTTGVTHVAYSRHFSYTGIALYESLVNGDKNYPSIAGRLNGTIVLPAEQKGKPYFRPSAGNAAIADMLRFFYSAKPANIQSIDSLEQVYASVYQAENKNADLSSSIQFGKQVAAAIIDWSKTDGAANANIPYTPLGEGYWEPTPSTFAAANVPGWGNNRTILPGSITNTIPGAPLSFSKDAGTPFYNMVKEVYDISQTLTNEQKAIANFWDDAPNGSNVTAFGHWFSILKQVLEKDNTSLMKAADAYMRLGITMNESTISCWKSKYTYNQLRPVTYIRKYMGYSDWNSIISTPPHPEYSAAHATISASAAYALESVFGNNFSFTDHTYDAIGMNARTFTNFEAAGDEAGISRLYGGIHYRPSIETGKIQGRKVGENVKNLLTALH